MCPFLLDFIQGRTTRSATTAVSFGLSAGFIFGLGAPMALSTGVLNPWLLFLPTDILGMLSPKKWLAPVLGGAWGAVVVFGLNGANNIAHDLPVDFLTAMQQMSTPILFLFTLFPVLAITKQFGRTWGGIAGVLELALVVMTMKLWPNMFAGAPAMAVGVLMLIGLAVSKDLRQRRTDRAAGVVEEVGGDDPMASLFSTSAARLRKYLPLFMVLGAGVCVLAQTHVFGGGEATSFLIAKGQYTEAAQVDFYRVFGAPHPGVRAGADPPPRRGRGGAAAGRAESRRRGCDGRPVAGAVPAGPCGGNADRHGRGGAGRRTPGVVVGRSRRARTIPGPSIAVRGLSRVYWILLRSRRKAPLRGLMSKNISGGEPFCQTGKATNCGKSRNSSTGSMPGSTPCAGWPPMASSTL